jgi:cell wall-associated NlpC family hydrolase
MHTTQTPKRHSARRFHRLLCWSTLAASTAVALATFDASPASAEVAGDPQSPAVALTATAALREYDELTAARTSAPRYDQASAYRAGYQFRKFARARNKAADATAAELGTDPRAVRAAWRSADVAHQVAVLAALSQLGVEYRPATSEPGVGFDCSGLTAYAWGRAGTALARQSGSQISAAEPRDHDTAQAGDLVQYPGHVMMYLGVEDAIVHAANPASDVELSRVGDRSLNWGDPSV